ncbi:MBL fold metallo-hydrolase [Streptomyces sp. BE303]|uniref:MBL fold metallo-hydrolase n=1 Tax=Streptomyces sp. BE303 TaxID=3002528 RepID=UPI002E759D27|nr:MBL fold metallo-hydrolase [Streptomyces sp. BE303]MED7950334.1 MBL fold metallo-hydrolase [Streptomyces sp. BE303]
MTELLAPHGAPDADRVRVREVADGVYAYVQEPGGWCLNNAGVVLGGGESLLVDTAATERRARRLREAVNGLTAAPPRLLVLTHFHGDHVFGSAVAAPEAAVVAHEHARREMTEAGLGLTGLWPDVDWGRIEVRLPHLTYRDRLTVHVGDRPVELLHFGPAHTTGDTLVWLPDDGVLFAGDVVLNGCTPFVLMGSVRGTLRTLERLRELAPRTVVPGHGPVAGPEVLDETAAYLDWLLRTAEAGRAAGLSPLETARDAGPGPYPHWLDGERVVGNLHRAYAELDGEPEGVALDVVRIFGELVEYNGGRLPDCYA